MSQEIYLEDRWGNWETRNIQDRETTKIKQEQEMHFISPVPWIIFMTEDAIWLEALWRHDHLKYNKKSQHLWLLG